MGIKILFVSYQHSHGFQQWLAMDKVTGHWIRLLLLLCSHSPNDVPPEPQRNVSIAAVRGVVRPAITGSDKVVSSFITK